MVSFLAAANAAVSQDLDASTILWYKLNEALDFSSVSAALAPDIFKAIAPAITAATTHQVTGFVATAMNAAHNEPPASKAVPPAIIHQPPKRLEIHILAIPSHPNQPTRFFANNAHMARLGCADTTLTIC